MATLMETKLEWTDDLCWMAIVLLFVFIFLVYVFCGFVV